jgi:hypothetical protein
MTPIGAVEIVKAGEPHSVESVQMLCLQCPLTTCDEEDPGCLIRIARRRDKRLHNYMYYLEWLGAGDEERLKRREQRQRDAAIRRRAKRKKDRRTQ